jgi:DNA-binding MarR family transcriptional regulator
MENELKKSIGYKLNQTVNYLNNSFNQVLNKHEIAIEQRATLEIIKYEKNVNQTMIAQILGKDKTTISRTLKTLEKKGYISKNEMDKRTNLIKLTPSGEEVFQKSFNDVKNFRAKIASNLSQEEIEQLFKTLDKVISSTRE